jgi:hypothetical protein
MLISSDTLNILLYGQHEMWQLSAKVLNNEGMENEIKNLTCEIWGSHSGAGEDAGPYEYDM